ncbi:spore germination protein [Paenibacillus alginolyticus]|uniref:Spore germination protein n=1 Tax=Paenibacillus alginolyticus TaxID=59839 RepID=A0ABT4GHS7_9BACL|nr:endospore germination permease [Paenibacillus alginolyticus]MCY9663892.1 spore germination protein [Paenibacillus alginolyticus]MCY9695744.1 spore germination protein [Paenibacillus alginolyticus]MEC0142282.1 endospore germination permease [Paenibacillus alginolyticus]
MRKYSFNQISLTQYIFIIFETQVGIGVLSLPRDLAKTGGTDGWISILLGWMLSLILSLVVIQIMGKNPEYTLLELLSQYFGKWVGKSLSVIWILYAAYAASVVMFSTINMIKLWIVPEVRDFILMILFIIPIYIITKQGIRVIGIFAEIVFIVSLWMPFLLLYAFKDSHWLFLLPIGKEGFFPILSTVKSTILSFLGFELAFILYPFLTDKKSASKGILIANSLSMIIFVTVTVISFVRFSPDEIKDYAYPTLNLLKLIQLPFLERLEIIFLSIYLCTLFMTIIPYLYTAALGASQLCGKQDHRNVLRILMCLWVLSSFIFIPSSSQINQMGKSWGAAGTYVAYVFPILLWIYGRLFHHAGKEPKQ